MKTSQLLTLTAAALLANVASAQQVLSSFPASGAEQHLARSGPDDSNRSGHAMSSAGSIGGQSWISGTSWTFEKEDARVGQKFERKDEWDISPADMGHDKGSHYFEQWDHFEFGCRSDTGLNYGGAIGFDSSASCSPIPEPSTYAALLGLAAFGLAVRRRGMTRSSRKLRGQECNCAKY